MSALNVGQRSERAGEHLRSSVCITGRMKAHRTWRGGPDVIAMVRGHVRPRGSAKSPDRRACAASFGVRVTTFDHTSDPLIVRVRGLGGQGRRPCDWLVVLTFLCQFNYEVRSSRAGSWSNGSRSDLLPRRSRFRQSDASAQIVAIPAMLVQRDGDRGRNRRGDGCAFRRPFHL